MAAGFSSHWPGAGVAARRGDLGARVAEEQLKAQDEILADAHTAWGAAGGIQPLEDAKHCVHHRRQPRNPGLITVRGLQCLTSADVVLHDHVVHPRLLRHARAEVRRSSTSGLAAPQPLDQEAICYLLAEKAREGRIVARLKWGNPLVFARGGAEALLSPRTGSALRGGAWHPRGHRRRELTLAYR